MSVRVRPKGATIASADLSKRLAQVNALNRAIRGWADSIPKLVQARLMDSFENYGAGARAAAHLRSYRLLIDWRLRISTRESAVIAQRCFSSCGARQRGKDGYYRAYARITCSTGRRSDLGNAEP
jgi:hypothetical protein